MRINRVSTFGFGPYAKKIDLDFTKLNEEGIFLITGNTGAGKTTIFDIITFSLFGKTNFDDSEKKGKVICDFIPKSEEKNVYTEVDFTIAGDNYRVRREPDYLVPGNKNSKGERLFVYKNSEEIDKKKGELEKYIVNDVVKLTYEQFKKILMLAQGSFSDFIKSSSNDKTELLNKIFGTDFFKVYENSVKEEYDKIKKDVEKKREEILHSVKSLNLENEEVSNRIENSNLDFQFFQNVLEEKISEYIVEIEKLNTEKKDHDSSHLIKEKATLEKRNSDILAYEKKKLEYSEHIKNESAYLEKSKELEASNLAKEDEKFLIARDNSQKNVEKLKVERDKLNNEISKLSTIEEIKCSLEKVEKELDSTSLEIGKLGVFSRDINELSSKKIEEKDLNNDISSSTLKYNFLLENIEENSKKLSEKKSKLEIFKEENSKRVTISESLLLEKEKEKTYQNVVSDFNTLIHEAHVLGELDTEVQFLSNEFKEIESRIKVERLTFERNEYYNIAKKLVDNAPCPVCGSKEHPSIATPTTEALSLEELEKLDVEYSNKKEKFHKESGKVEEKKKSYQEKEEKLHLVVKELGVEFDLHTIKNHLRLISGKCEEIQNEIKKLPSEKEIATLEKEIDRLSKDLEKEKEELSKLDKEIVLLSTRKNETTIRICEILKNLEKENIKVEDFDKILSNLQKSKNILEEDKACLKINEEKVIKLNQEKISKVYQLEKEELLLISTCEELRRALVKNNLSEEEFKMLLLFNREKAQKELNEYFNKKSNLEGALNQYKELDGKEVVDLTEINEKIKAEQEIVASLEKEITKLSSELLNIERVKTILQKEQDKLALKIEEFENLENLYKILSGKAGNSRISFEKFVLRKYFSQVVEEANIKFREMTNNQYEMRIADLDSILARGSIGLELNVFDSHTGKERSIKTLSGGETFKASMALALGLSNIVQYQNGAIELDSVFIDEGFGTLDEESLSIAMDILSDIKSSGRTVGIISHVSELKSTINAQIIVEKSKVGSDARIVTE